MYDLDSWTVTAPLSVIEELEMFDEDVLVLNDSMNWVDAKEQVLMRGRRLD